MALPVASSGCVGVNSSHSSLKALENPLLCIRRVSFGWDFHPPCVPLKGRLSSSVSTITPRASSATALKDGKPDGNYDDTDAIPTPKVIIDQDSDPNATIVEITFGDRLGALLDTMNALKNLGLNVVKANVFLDSSGKHNTFAITKA